MRSISRILVFIITSCIFVHYLPAQDETYRLMQQGFQNPPLSSRPAVYYWWLGGNVDTVRLKEEILAFKNAGISGFTILEIGSRDTIHIKSGPAFLSEESLQIIKCATKEAGKYGMEVGLNTASSWNAGGNWLPPEHCAKSIYSAKTETSGGKTLNIKLPFPDISQNDAWGKPRFIKFGSNGRPVFYKEIAVLAVPANIGRARLDTVKIVNVSRFFNPETEILNWEAPSGDWKILRYVCSNSGENLVLPSKYSAGPIVDHYDADATEFHFTYIIRKLESVLGDLEKSSFKSLYMASYEEKGLTWTTTLPDIFKQINGYNIEKFLPSLFNEGEFSPEVMANFKLDFQRTLSELMINNFYKKSKEICNKYGLKNNCEAGGPGRPLHNVPVEPLKALGALDIPRGEFWINHSRFNEKGIDIMRVIKEVSSASHIYNRGLVEMEAFTSFRHWQEGPFEMKPAGDRAFCEGMNKVVVHGSAHNPSGTGFPGIVYHAGTHYNDKRVWWPKIRPFNEYLSRISFVLQEANFVADVLYYYGDTIPNYGGHKNSRFTAGPGYDYEIVNTDILKKLTVKNNMIVIPVTGARFNILALTDESEIDPEVLIKLNELAKKGAIITGAKPRRVATRKIQPGMPDMNKLPDELWTDYDSEGIQKTKARIYSGIDPAQMLGLLGVTPDISYPGEELFTLDYTHYSKDNMDFYFLRNTTGEWISREISVRQQNKIPEIWDPVSGEIIPLILFNEEKEHIIVPVTLAPYGSIFLVFSQGDPAPRYTNIVNYGQHPPLLSYTREGICFLKDGIIELVNSETTKTVNNIIKEEAIEGAWEVFFPKGWGAPEKEVFPELISWTESENKGIKYFSGIARYEKTFLYEINSDLSENPKIYLDLGDLSRVGEVWLNNKSLGITWAKPYRFDVTGLLKPGVNKLIVEIANTWSNRLTGDAVNGEKYTNTNITVTEPEKGYFVDLPWKNNLSTGSGQLNYAYFPWKDVPLLKSGLFGPVKLITIKIVN